MLLTPILPAHRTYLSLWRRQDQLHEKYDKLALENSVRFNPISLEVSGRLGPGARTFLEVVATKAAEGAPSFRVCSNADKGRFKAEFKLRAIRAISCSTAHSNYLMYSEAVAKASGCAESTCGLYNVFKKRGSGVLRRL